MGKMTYLVPGGPGMDGLYQPEDFLNGRAEWARQLVIRYVGQTSQRHT